MQESSSLNKEDYGLRPDINWMHDMNAEEEQATDQIIDYLLKSGARPHVKANGDIVEIVTAITNNLKPSIPPHLSEQLKTMLNYLSRFLCDYVQNYNVTSLNINFGFGAKPSHSEGVN
jgi:hypothetical protein